MTTTKKTPVKKTSTKRNTKVGVTLPDFQKTFQAVHGACLEVLKETGATEASVEYGGIKLTLKVAAKDKKGKKQQKK